MPTGGFIDNLILQQKNNLSEITLTYCIKQILTEFNTHHNTSWILNNLQLRKNHNICSQYWIARCLFIPTSIFCIIPKPLKLQITTVNTHHSCVRAVILIEHFAGIEKFSLWSNVNYVRIATSIADLWN